MKKILFITTKYATTKNNLYLTNEVVDELNRRNYHVTVLALGDNNLINKNAMVNEKIVKISDGIKYLKYIPAWFILANQMLKLIRHNNQYEQIIATAPLIVIWPCIVLLKLIKSNKKTVFIFDYFPEHQIQSFSIPKYMGKIGKKIETLLLNNFTECVVMGNKNKEFIGKYYTNCNPVNNIKIINLWGMDSKITAKPYCRGAIKMIYGGQIIKGRKVEILINLISKLRDRNLNINLDFYSSGSYFQNLSIKYKNYDWIKFMPIIPRNEYKNVLSKYNVGVLITDAEVKLPAFPSKIIDYIYSELFVLAIVEKESELHDIFSRYKRVKLNFFDFSDDAVEELEQWLNFVKLNKNYHECLEMKEIFNINNAITVLLK